MERNHKYRNHINSIIHRFCSYNSIRYIILFIWIPWIIIYLIYSIQLIRYPYDWEPGEGSKIIYAQHILDRCPVYKSNETFPMLGNCYPPIYPMLIAIFCTLTRINIGCGRFISVIATLIMLLLICKIVRTRTDSYIWSIVGAGCFVMPSFLTNWYSLARMDSVCSCFLLGMIYIISKQGKSNVRAILTAVLAVCALFTKQTAIFVVGMCAIYYLANKKWQELSIFCITLLILGGSAFLVCNYLSNGWFYKNILTENTHRLFLLKRYNTFFGILIKNYPWAWISTGCIVGLKIYRKQWDIWLFYCIGGFANALLIGANGAGMNYFITLWSAVALFFSEGIYLVWRSIENLSSRISKKYICGILIFLCVVISTNIVDNAYGFFYRKNLLSYIPSSKDYSSMQAIESIIRTTKGSVLVDRLPSITIRCGKSDYYIEPAFIQELYRAKQWDPMPLVKMIENRNFDVICLFYQSLLPKPVKDSIRKYYLLSAHIEVGTFEIWRRRVILIYRKPPKFCIK